MKRNNSTKIFDQKRKGLMAPCAFLLGFTAVVIQVFLVRALMSAFGGNELVFAVVLAVWLSGVALGAVVIRGKGLLLAAFLFFLLLLSAPAVWIGAKLLGIFLGIPFGSVPDIIRVAWAAVLLLLPMTVIMGGLFRIMADVSQDARYVYGYEALGFVAGGLLTTFVFILPLPGAVVSWAQQKALPGYRILAVEQTRYGELVVGERSGQKSFFGNGRLLFTSADALSSEEVHLVLSVHPAPGRVFMAGGGLFEGAREALKHPLSRLDYAELDPALVDLERREAPGIPDPRCSALPADPRAALRGPGQGYDVIVLNTGDPTSLLSGRFFTQEFFMTARRRLLSGGIVSVTVSSSENYVSEQGSAYVRSVFATLRSVFRYVNVIPGERWTFLASDTAYELSAEDLSRRIQERGIDVEYMRPFYLKDRMSRSRMDMAHALLERQGEVSRDAHPVTVLHALVYATTRSGEGFSRAMYFIRHSGWLMWIFLPLGLFVVARRQRNRIPLCGSGVAGFSQMVFQLAAVLMVQSVFGYAYAAIGLLTAGFMIGIFWGTRFFPDVSAGVSVVMQALSGLFFIAAMHRPELLFVFPVLAGVVGGTQFTAYCAMAGHAQAAKIYAADVLGAAFGALCAGLVLIPLWGMTSTMLFIVLLNAAMWFLLRSYPARESSER